MDPYAWENDLDEDDFDDWEWDDYCHRCDGDGEIMVCPDDLCRGAGTCAVGSPRPGCFMTCPECKGAGEAAGW